MLGKVWNKSERDMASMTQLSISQFTQPDPDESTDNIATSTMIEDISYPSLEISEIEIFEPKNVEKQMKIDFFVPKPKSKNSPLKFISGPVSEFDEFIENDVPEQAPKLVTKAMEDAKQFILFEAEVGNPKKDFENSKSDFENSLIERLSDDSGDESFNQAVLEAAKVRVI